MSGGDKANIFFGLFIATILLAFAGFVLHDGGFSSGLKDGRHEMEAEAVNHGYGKIVVGDGGEFVFQWNETGEVGE